MFRPHPSSLAAAIVVLFVFAADAVADEPQAPQVSVAGCSDGRPAKCLLAITGQNRLEFQLTDNPHAIPMAVGLIGQQFSGQLPAAYVYWKTGEDWETWAKLGSTDKASLVALSIFDLNGRGLVAQIAPPKSDSAKNFKGYSAHDTYFGIVQGPAGKRYPFLAPGMRYLNIPHWDYLCIFDPAALAKPDPACGRGSKRDSATFPGADKLAGVRHDGGWLEDVDGDGWQDINLPFLNGYILTISGRTGRQLALLHFDVAAHSEPNSPPFFHSGRLYGSFTPFTASNGKSNVLIASASPVGTFNDFYCNVSRYYAVLETKNSSDPASRDLKWSDYISFDATIYPFNKASFSNAQPDQILRQGDFNNKCVHRVSDSLFHASGRPLTVYNYFMTDPPLPADSCQKERYGEVLEMRRGVNPPREAQKLLVACAKATWLPATGDWSVRTLNLDNGALVSEWKNAYVWGRVRDFVPRQAETFIVELMDERVRFDQRGHTPKQFMVAGIGPDFTWRRFGVLPVAIGPKMMMQPPSLTTPYEGTVGTSQYKIVEIQTRPRHDGLVDIKLEDGRWVGYSAENQGFALQP